VGDKVRRFRRLVCNCSQIPGANDKMRTLLSELNLELGRTPRSDAFDRIQRILLNTGGGIYDGDERLRNALSDLGLTGTTQQ
jgi:hypothetical protein